VLVFDRAGEIIGHAGQRIDAGRQAWHKALLRRQQFHSFVARQRLAPNLDILRGNSLDR
jgi:hypothetical protein